MLFYFVKEGATRNPNDSFASIFSILSSWASGASMIPFYGFSSKVREIIDWVMSFYYDISSLSSTTSIGLASPDTFISVKWKAAIAAWACFESELYLVSKISGLELGELAVLHIHGLVHAEHSIGYSYCFHEHLDYMKCLLFNINNGPLTLIIIWNAYQKNFGFATEAACEAHKSIFIRDIEQEREEI